MAIASRDPVLLVGGSGVVGVRAARTLRRLHPELPLAVAGRDLARASAVAAEIGGAVALSVDLAREDLGLPPQSRFSAVLVFVKDAGMHTMRYAQARGLPYLAFSDFSFDIAPAIGLFVRSPASAPVLLLGHAMGGIATLAALHFARELGPVQSIHIAAVVGPDDTGGPAAQADFGRHAGHGALALQDGQWVWLQGEQAVRTIVDRAGVRREAHAYSLLDVVSLAAETSARSLRVDLAAREPTGAVRSTEVLIELVGPSSTVRVEMVDDDVHARISAYGAALATERLLGLRGGPPVGPGLYHPESVLDPSEVMARLPELGVQIRVIRGERAAKIGLIGSGQVGGALVRRLRALGHEVFVANSRGPESLAELARETGAHPVSVHEAARAGEIVILAIPQREVARLPHDLFDGVPPQTVIVDAGNYYPRHRDGRIEAIEAGRAESRWVADTLGRPVVKAFNNLWAKDLEERGRPSGAPERIALPVAGDEPVAKAKVVQLVDELGFDAVDAGGLDDSWRQQPGTPVYTANLDVNGTARRLAEAVRQRQAELSGTAQSPGTWAEPR
jgi:predicted dinucleotide-binding enzyme